MTDVVASLRRARIARGMTQREVAGVLGTTQSAVSRLESGTVVPRLDTVEAYAAAVGTRVGLDGSELTADCARDVQDALGRGDADAALRAVIQLFDDLLASPTATAVAALAVEPPPTGSPAWDAAIAAACERGARLTGARVPGWTAAPSRFLDRWWLPVGDILGRVTTGMMCLALVTSPPEFAIRGVLIDPATLQGLLTPLSRDDVVRFQEEVAAELEGRGVRGQLFLVGGAAVAYGRDRLTRDVDAVFEPKQVVYEAARKVARRNGLADDWLNDAVKGFLPGDDPDATTFLDLPGLTVQVASPRYLFTLKALASRVDRDAADLVTLFGLSGFASVDDALAHVHRTAPPGLVHPKTEFFVRELLGGNHHDQA